jgi:hypothetical protein
VLEGATTPN